MQIGQLLKDFYLQIKRFLMNGLSNETRSKYVPTENPDSGAQLAQILPKLELPKEKPQKRKKKRDIGKEVLEAVKDIKKLDQRSSKKTAEG